MLWVRDRPLLGVPRTWRARRWPVFLLLAPSLWRSMPDSMLYDSATSPRPAEHRLGSLHFEP